MTTTETKRGRPPKPSVDAPDISAELRALSRQIRRYQNRLQPLEQQRNDAVQRGLALGMSHGQLARETGLTRGRIGQIAMRLDGDR